MKKLLCITFGFLLAVPAWSLTVSITKTKDICNHSNGTMTANPSGGTAPYTYLWSNGATVQTITGLSAGTTRTVTVTDNAGSTAAASATIQAQTHLSGGYALWEAGNPCEGMCNGIAHISEPLLDGIPPYSGTFDGNLMGGSGTCWAGNLNAFHACWNGGGYIYISDATGCDTSWYEPIQYVPYPVIYSIAVTPACTGNTGVANVSSNEVWSLSGQYCYRLLNSSGGVINYPSSSYITGLAAGTYSFQLITTRGSCGFPYYTDTCSIATQQFTIAGCSVPTNRTTTNITSTKATLNWITNNCAISYKVKYRPVGTVTYTNKNTNGNVSYKNITGLTPNTQYQWRVRSKCGSNPNIWSNWSGAVSFTTSLRLGEFDEETNLTIYPNPAAGFLSVGIEGNDQLSHILIQNSLGQMVLEKNLDEEETSATELDVSALPAGVYLLMVFTSTGKTTKIFVKE